jgi:hypothetical protein
VDSGCVTLCVREGGREGGGEMGMLCANSKNRKGDLTPPMSPYTIDFQFSECVRAYVLACK